MKLKDSELKNILSEVEAELGSLLKAEQEKLVKAAPTDDDSSADDSAPSDEGSAPGADAGAEGSAPAPGPEASAPGDEGSAPMGDEGMAPAPDQQMDPAADASAPADPAMLEAEYSKLPPEELKAHYMAAKAALFKVMGAGGDAAPSPDAGMAPPPAAPGADAGAMGAGVPPPPDASADPMMGKMELGSIAPSKAGAGKDRLDPVAPTKADGGEDRLAAIAPAKKGELSAGKKLDINHGGQGDHNLGKSEGGLSKSEREELTELKGTVAGLLDLLSKPMRKAVTSVDYVPRAEVQEKRKNLSKAEVTAKLSEVTRDPSLKKSDRALVNDYFDGKIDLGQIEHLLK